MLSRVASWHHGSAVWPILTPMRWRSASRPSSVILGELRSIVLTFRSQDLAVDLAGRRLGQLGHELDEARIFVLAESLPHEVLDFLGEAFVAATIGDDECLDHLSAQLVGHADGPDFAHVGMLQLRVLDLD